MGTISRCLGMARSAAIYSGGPFRSRRMEAFYSQFVTEGALCFDIGAHTGDRLRCWRALGARVVAVEPQEDFISLLRRFYGRDPSVVLLKRAVGRSPGRATLYVSERHPTVTTLSRDWIELVRNDPSFESVQWSETAETEVTTLQTLIERYGRPAFIKLDVEGYEAEALAGLSTAVASVSFEYVPAARHIALECIDRLAELGRYCFNWSSGETHALAAGEWLDPEGIRRLITHLPERARSGDIYAALLGAR